MCRCAKLGVKVAYVPTLVPGRDLPAPPVTEEEMRELAQEVLKHPELVSGDRKNEVLAETITTMNGQGAHINGGRPRPSRSRMSSACRPGGHLRPVVLRIAQYLTTHSPTPAPPGHPAVRGGRHFAASFCERNKYVLISRDTCHHACDDVPCRYESFALVMRDCGLHVDVFNCFRE